MIKKQAPIYSVLIAVVIFVHETSRTD